MCGPVFHAAATNWNTAGAGTPGVFKRPRPVMRRAEEEGQRRSLLRYVKGHGCVLRCGPPWNDSSRGMGMGQAVQNVDNQNCSAQGMRVGGCFGVFQEGKPTRASLKYKMVPC